MSINNLLLVIFVTIIIVLFWNKMNDKPINDNFKIVRINEKKINKEKINENIEDILLDDDCDIDSKKRNTLSMRRPIFCPRPVKTIQQFNKEFFNFRDKFTNENSSIRLDGVDKITELRINGDLDQARGSTQNIRIQDLYNYLTDSGPNLTPNNCVRLTKFDNTMHDGYDASFVTGLSGTMDEFEYKGERPINGGALECGIYPYDQGFSNLMPALQTIVP